MLLRRPRMLLALVAATLLLATACEAEEGDPLADDTDTPAQTPTDGTETPTDGTETPTGEATPLGGDLLTGDPESTVVEVLEDSGEFSRLLELLQEAGLDTQLEGSGPFTVFAPSDEAFERLPDALVERFEVHAEQRDTMLQSHVATQEVRSADLTDDATVEMLDGSVRTVLVTTDGMVLLGPAAVVDADAEASNGVVHAIDLVLSPVEVPEE